LRPADCPKWEDDKDSALPGIALAAQSFAKFAERQNPKQHILTHGDIKVWHHRLFENTVPKSYYAGYYRGVDPKHPCLEADVRVGPNIGTPANDVERQMKEFSDELGRAINKVDQFCSSQRPMADRIKAAARIAAFAGGSIIKIHPFINGNGRMARLVMNFFLHRYLDIAIFAINRPKDPFSPTYEEASEVAMRDGNFAILYQYLIGSIASKLAV